MFNLSDDSASGSHTAVSTPELPKLPYEIFLLVVEAFLKSAHAEFSIDPASWQLECEPVRRRHIPIPEVYYIDDCDDDGDDMRGKRFSLLRGVSQVDLRSRRMVNHWFPRLAFLEHGIYHAHRFTHVCAKVDVFLFSAPLHIPHFEPRFLDLLRLLEHVHFVDGDFDLESLSVMPSLKSVGFPKIIDTMGPHEHGKSSFAQEPHARVFSPPQWVAIRESSSIWEKGVRLFVNPCGSWYSRDWQLAELFYLPASAGKRDAVRILSVDIFEHDWEPTYTTKPSLRSLSQPAPDNLGLLRAIENIQLHAWCGTDPGLPSFLSALPNLRTVSFVWQPPGPYGPPAANPSFHAHNDPPAVYETHSRIVEITEW
ncbi:hypothetical protein CGCF413_v007244 [Colletotrichum fructicola]|nr:hypothetical protein CGCF413_v007244 [Colletotrichum fructicola]